MSSSSSSSGSSGSSGGSNDPNPAAPLVKARAHPKGGEVLVLEQEGRLSVLRGVASYIIVNEFCERLAFYGFAGSLVLFFQTKMGMSNAEADIQVIWLLLVTDGCLTFVLCHSILHGTGRVT